MLKMLKNTMLIFALSVSGFMLYAQDQTVESDEFFWSAKDTIKMSILLAIPPTFKTFDEEGWPTGKPIHIFGDKHIEYKDLFYLHANPKAVDLLIDSFQNHSSDTNFNKIQTFGNHANNNFFFLMDFKHVDVIIDMFSKVSFGVSSDMFRFYTILSDRGFVFSKKQKEFLLKIPPRLLKINSPLDVSSIESLLSELKRSKNYDKYLQDFNLVNKSWFDSTMKKPKYAAILNKKVYEGNVLLYNNFLSDAKRRENANWEIRELSSELLDVVRKHQNIINIDDKRLEGVFSSLGIVEDALSE